MLIQFSVKNFKTFKEKAVLSLVASNYDTETRETDNIKQDKKFNLRLLKSAVIYGANASGKTKFFEALMFMKFFVISSYNRSQRSDAIDVDPFRLNSESEELPVEFEIVFIHENIMYRYGFEANKKKIISEWLYYKPKTKEIELFCRTGNKFETHDRDFSKGKTIIKEGLVRENALLLSVAAQFNDLTSMTVIDWFKYLQIISGIKERDYQFFSMFRTESPAHKAEILALLKVADLGIQDIELQELDLDQMARELPKEKFFSEPRLLFEIFAAHKKYDSNKKATDIVNFSLEVDESSGTRKFFALTGPILSAIENGSALVVDELDSKLHPNLVRTIISLFNSKELNKKNAQLIFNTHNTNLLSSELFRRDQIWFTDKDKFGEATLYSLADFKSDKVRKTESFEENYIRGKYGAVPIFDDFDDLNNMLHQYENEEQKS